MLQALRRFAPVGLAGLLAVTMTVSPVSAQGDGDERLITRLDSTQIGFVAETKLKSLDRDLVPELAVAGPSLIGDRELSIRYLARAAGVGPPAGSGMTGKGRIRVTFQCVTADGSEKLAARGARFGKFGNAAIQLTVTPTEPCDSVRAVRRFRGALTVEEGGTLSERFSVTPLEPLSARLEEPCVPGDTALCLQGGRFQVETQWRDFGGKRGNGFVMPDGNDQLTFFFFSRDNWEILVRVLDGCSFNNHFWVFAGGLTNVEVDITVTDTTNGMVQTFQNPLGSPFAPIQDTSAFATCP